MLTLLACVSMSSTKTHASHMWTLLMSIMQLLHTDDNHEQIKCMYKLCVPALLFSSPSERLGTRLINTIIQVDLRCWQPQHTTHTCCTHTQHTLAVHTHNTHRLVTTDTSIFLVSHLCSLYIVAFSHNLALIKF